jgi:hypothetical protein
VPGHPAAQRWADIPSLHGPHVMSAMLGTRGTNTARLHWLSHAMPSQDCLYIRLSGYLEARCHAPDGDQAPTAIVDRQSLVPEERGEPGTKVVRATENVEV